MTAQGLSPRDPSSFSRPELASVSNIFLNLTVNFEKKTLRGSVDLTIEKHNPKVGEVILDAKDLNISQIVNKETNEELDFTLSEPVGEFGSKLSITLPKWANQNVLTVFYETSPKASGLQWLTPEQTAGKVHPFLFSQFQAIAARSALPCQDTPGVKTKYHATITAPKSFTTLMSAIPKESKIEGDVKKSDFVQDVPVPAYLIALAVGALESRHIGPRTHVWAEKEIIEDCAFEFAETEQQLKTAEDLCGLYVWGIYDLLVLPPSFAFGGMENPCLTFVTPTLLAGDRSLSNVVAHEIAHSWTGNLITNRNFEHFWLNEGFTMFVERKVKGRLTTIQDADFDAYRSVLELQETVKQLGEDNPLTQLVVDLRGVHPDDAFSNVPYEKGYTFLRYLEKTVGGPDQFEPFLRKYFDTFKLKSIDTSDFKVFFENYFGDNTAAVKTIDWDKWLYSTGMPPILPDFDTSCAEAVDKVLDQFIQDLPIDPDDTNALTANQKIYLLQKLVDSKPLTIEKLKALDELFGFSKAQNSEIKFRWYRLGLKAQWEDVIDPVLKWVSEVGRMKFVRPLYRELYAWEDARLRAIENFSKHRSSMMHVVSYTLTKDLHLDSS